MSKTVMCVSFEDEDMITLSINRDHFKRGVADPESYKRLINEIEHMIYIALHFDDDIGMKPPIPTFTRGVSV